MFVIARCPKIDEAITTELERNTRTGKHARFLPTVPQRRLYPVAVSAKSMRAGTTGNQSCYRCHWRKGS